MTRERDSDNTNGSEVIKGFSVPLDDLKDGIKAYFSNKGYLTDESVGKTFPKAKKSLVRLLNVNTEGLLTGEKDNYVLTDTVVAGFLNSSEVDDFSKFLGKHRSPTSVVGRNYGFGEENFNAVKYALKEYRTTVLQEDSNDI